MMNFKQAVGKWKPSFVKRGILRANLNDTGRSQGDRVSERKPPSIAGSSAARLTILWKNQNTLQMLQQFLDEEKKMLKKCILKLKANLAGEILKLPAKIGGRNNFILAIDNFSNTLYC